MGNLELSSRSIPSFHPLPSSVGFFFCQIVSPTSFFHPAFLCSRSSSSPLLCLFLSLYLSLSLSHSCLLHPSTPSSLHFLFTRRVLFCFILTLRPAVHPLAFVRWRENQRYTPRFVYAKDVYCLPTGRCAKQTIFMCLE